MDPFDVSDEECERIVMEVNKVISATLLPFVVSGITAKSQGVQGDGAVYFPGVELSYTDKTSLQSPQTVQMLSTRIVNEVRGISRVVIVIPI